MNVKIADRVRNAVTIVSGLIMIYALFVSADHISHVAGFIGLHGYQQYTLFVLIDIPALVGKALRLKYFAAGTRRTGLRLMLFSGALSLVCNTSSGWIGGGLGPAGYGVFVVVMFLIMENVVTKIKPAAAVTRVKNAGKVETPAAPRKRAATPRKRTPKVTTVAELERTYRLPSAPVSPA